ncbi:MAG: hypothetical protein Q4D58_10140 [Synergistaceae bacterium]|nr:hypothetical protein [Synergistaceae bacterium]
MNERPRTRVWVVARIDEGHITQADVFDNGDDAQNFAGELSVDTNNLSGRFQVLDSYIHCKELDYDKGIDPENFAQSQIDALYNDLGLDSTHGAETQKAAQYIVDHKPELLEEASRLIKKHILDVLKKKHLLTK